MQFLKIKKRKRY